MVGIFCTTSPISSSGDIIPRYISYLNKMLHNACSSSVDYYSFKLIFRQSAMICINALLFGQCWRLESGQEDNVCNSRCIYHNVNSAKQQLRLNDCVLSNVEDDLQQKLAAIIMPLLVIKISSQLLPDLTTQVEILSLMSL